MPGNERSKYHLYIIVIVHISAKQLWITLYRLKYCQLSRKYNIDNMGENLMAVEMVFPLQKEGLGAVIGLLLPLEDVEEAEARCGQTYK